MLIKYRDTKFRKSTLGIIEKANSIIEEYDAQGFNLTLRQLYYKFIGRDLFPDSWIDEAYNLKHGLAPDTKNTEKNYNRLGETITSGRYGGLVSWAAIVDRRRAPKYNPHWSSAAEIIRAAAEGFGIDKWEGQDNYVEVWVEKEALVGVVGRICDELDVPYLACLGYLSASEAWASAMRMYAMQKNEGRTPHVLHLGDHDPSGIDMTRDNIDRLCEFAGIENMHRLALNMDQIRKFNPPPNPTKPTDSRSTGYEAKYGDECWELDALEPKTITQLISKKVKALRNERLWKLKCEEEEEKRKHLTAVTNYWEEVVAYMEHHGMVED